MQAKQIQKEDVVAVVISSHVLELTRKRSSRPPTAVPGPGPAVQPAIPTQGHLRPAGQDHRLRLPGAALCRRRSPAAGDEFKSSIKAWVRDLRQNRRVITFVASKEGPSDVSQWAQQGVFAQGVQCPPGRRREDLHPGSIPQEAPPGGPRRSASVSRKPTPTSPTKSIPAPLSASREEPSTTENPRPVHPCIRGIRIDLELQSRPCSGSRARGRRLGGQGDQRERRAEALEDGMLLELAGGGAGAVRPLLGLAAGDEVGEDGGDLLQVLFDVGIQFDRGQDAVAVEVGVGGELISAICFGSLPGSSAPSPRSKV